ncbi:MAG TPA: gluconate 2-dehydrogenase subunit 3 family protein [Verrucomicrobiae bacterium]|nr:gluconate 2-dehydrogenase subunit 3 family protein [Verrucomicrobiae bacterium]
MDRREALRLLAAGASIPLFPGHLLAALREARAMVSQQSAPRTLNPHQFATVRTMAELILPKTDTPGATDVATAEFIDLMLTEWYDPVERDRFLSGLAAVDTRTQSLFSADFTAASLAQQSEILIELGEKMTEEAQRARDRAFAGNGTLAESPEGFYPMLRRLTLTSYYTSEQGATDELHFQIIPDRHDECAAIEPEKEAPEPR